MKKCTERCSNDVTLHPWIWEVENTSHGCALSVSVLPVLYIWALAHNSWTSAWEGMESGKYFLSTLSRVNTQFSLTSYSIAQNSLLRTGLKDKKEPHELVQIFIRSKEGQKSTNIINLKRKFCMIDKSVRSSIFVCGVSRAALSINLSADHPIWFHHAYIIM